MADTGEPPSSDRYAPARARMVALQLEARGIRDRATLDAMGRVPRERFVPPDSAWRAYEDGALPIGGGQTISQPFIVARMTEALDLDRWRAAHPGEPVRVLDVGTGSGYQAAVLAEMGAQVTSIEWDPHLSEAAGRRLAAAGYRVELVTGDGGAGYSPRAPYAGIVLAAAAPAAPPALVDQLADFGALVLPIGPGWHQELTRIRRHGDRVESDDLEPCVFVPLLGQFGYR
jgi:protein-L-isoaspartate(D-aspartate) O-methyltransferase